MTLTSHRPIARLALVVVLLAAALAMAAQLGSLPHLHAGAQSGLYNADHDLALLAALAAHGVQVAPVLAITIDLVWTRVLPRSIDCPAHDVASSADSRAPPSA